MSDQPRLGPPAAPQNLTDLAQGGAQGVLPGEVQVVIVGGGIMGLATAWHLARRGRQVVLLDKGALGGEQSGRAWGFVRQQDREPPELPLMVAANRMWPGLAAELGTDLEWRQEGLVALASTEEALAHYEARVKIEREHGVNSRLLNGAQARALLPGISIPLLGGLHTPTDGHAHAMRATLAFAAAAQRAGARLYAHTAVDRLVTSAGRITGVATTRGEIKAEVVICATGAHSARLLAGVGVSLPLRNTRSTVALTPPLPPITGLAVRGPRVSFRQAPNGQVLLGRSGSSAADYDITLEAFQHLGYFLPNFWKNRELLNLRMGKPLLADLWRALPVTPAGLRARAHPFAHTVDLEPPPNQRTVAALRRDFMACYPHLGDVAIERHWAGVIDTTPDIMPVIGPAPEREGLLIAAGFSGHGFALGPIVGKLLAEWVITGKPSLDLHAFRLTRFAEGKTAPARKLH